MQWQQAARLFSAARYECINSSIVQQQQSHKRSTSTYIYIYIYQVYNVYIYYICYINDTWYLVGCDWLYVCMSCVVIRYYYLSYSKSINNIRSIRFTISDNWRAFSAALLNVYTAKRQHNLSLCLSYLLLLYMYSIYISGNWLHVGGPSEHLRGLDKKRVFPHPYISLSLYILDSKYIPGIYIVSIYYQYLLLYPVCIYVSRICSTRETGVKLEGRPNTWYVFLLCVFPACWWQLTIWCIPGTRYLVCYSIFIFIFARHPIYYLRT